MNNRLIKLASSTALLMVAVITPCHAKLKAGVEEFSISGALYIIDGDASTGTVQGELTYGRYSTSKWLVGVRQLFSYALNDPIEDVWTASTTGFVNYHPWADKPGKRFQPFIGTFLGLAYSDVDVTGVAGPTAGIKYLMSEKSFFVAQYRYEAYFKKLEAGSETTDFDSGNHVFTIGIGLLW